MSLVSSLSALLLPLTSWLGLFALCRELAARRRIHPAPALSWVLASCGWAVILTLIVELSSAFHQLTSRVIANAWAASGVITVLSWGWLGMRRRALPAILRGAGIGRLRQVVQAWPADARFLACSTGFVVIATGLVAVGTSTTNYDSMTYHLPRVAHWVADRSVAHFPTTNWREIDFGPWAEFAMANFYVLEGGDWLVNLVQWFAMLTSVVAAVLLTQQLLPGWFPNGAGDEADAIASSTRSLRYRAPALAALLVATLPIGIAQSVTTQNDYVLACWVVCAASLTVALYQDPSNTWYALGLASAAAVGFLTKSTMALFSAPFIGGLLLYLVVRRRENLLALRLVLMLSLMFAAINAPYLWRNYSLYSAPLGTPEAMTLLNNETITVSGTASNLIRNASLYTATGIPPLTRGLNNLLVRFHRVTGRDINDPGLTFAYTPFTLQEKLVIADSVANSAYHLLMILGALALLPLSRISRKAEVSAFVLVAASAIVLFCATIRWQPWHSRFHLGTFVLLMPVTALVFSSTLPRRMVTALGCGLLVFGALCVLMNQTRPLRPSRGFLRLAREEQYFFVMPQAYRPYRDLADTVIASRCKNIGLHLQFDDWEYPYWALLRNRGFAGRLYHVGVQGPSAVLDRSPAPCAIITTSTTPPAMLIERLPYRTTYGGLTVWWAPEVRPEAAAEAHITAGPG